MCVWPHVLTRVYTLMVLNVRFLLRKDGASDAYCEFFTRRVTRALSDGRRVIGRDSRASNEGPRSLLVVIGVASLGNSILLKTIDVHVASFELPRKNCGFF